MDNMSLFSEYCQLDSFWFSLDEVVGHFIHSSLFHLILCCYNTCILENGCQFIFLKFMSQFSHFLDVSNWFHKYLF